MSANQQKAAALVPALLAWFAKNARDLPWRRTRNPYPIWISEIMLQQTQVKTVVPYWERWIHKLPTIQSVAKTSPAKLHKLWEGLGYYTRVRNLQKAAQQILTQHDGKFPENFDDILALPGIGRYTAGAICSIAFNQPTPVLDGNVVRVLTRLFGIAANPRKQKTSALLWNLAKKLVETAFEQEPSAPDRRRAKLLPLLGERAGVRAVVEHTSRNSCSHLNQSLMELGAVICTPRSPNCTLCPVRKLCVAYRKGQQEEFPNLAPRATPTSRRFAVFVAERRGCFLVRQRPASVVNAHLWEFPNVELSRGHADLRAAAGFVFGTAPEAIEPLCSLRHSITRYRITLEAYRVQLRKLPLKHTGVWLTRAQLRPLAFTSAHKKILARLKKTRRQQPQ